MLKMSFDDCKSEYSITSKTHWMLKTDFFYQPREFSGPLSVLNIQWFGQLEFHWCLLSTSVWFFTKFSELWKPESKNKKKNKNNSSNKKQQQEQNDRKPNNSNDDWRHFHQRGFTGQMIMDNIRLSFQVYLMCVVWFVWFACLFPHFFFTSITNSNKQKLNWFFECFVFCFVFSFFEACALLFFFVLCLATFLIQTQNNKSHKTPINKQKNTVKILKKYQKINVIS